MPDTTPTTCPVLPLLPGDTLQLTSLRTRVEIFAKPPQLLGGSFTLDNYRQVLADGQARIVGWRQGDLAAFELPPPSPAPVGRIFASEKRMPP